MEAPLGSENTQTWNQEFLLLQFCRCAPYSNATLERFFSKMRLLNKDWQNQLNKESLSLC